MCRIELTCKFHELVEVLHGEHGVAELPQVELQHARHRVDVASVGHVGGGVLAPLERLPEVVDLELAAGDPEDALVVEAVQVDDSDAALDDLRDVLHGGLQVLLQAAPEELGLARGQGAPDPPPRVGDRPGQGGSGQVRARLGVGGQVWGEDDGEAGEVPGRRACSGCCRTWLGASRSGWS